jgi:2-polyprenyl-3-methyl-5-hydroxy-6-metoxy-1,4-benzoquinol methylase
MENLQSSLVHSSVKSAYAGMSSTMSRHPWARYTNHEVDIVLNHLKLTTGARILDLGCGFGRHAIELAQQNYQVTGVDFTENSLKIAQASADAVGVSIDFINADACCFHPHTLFDAGIMLYDVLGSMPDDEHNRALLQTFVSSLRSGAPLVLSVMNGSLTEKLAFHYGDPIINPTLLDILPLSDVMAGTGDIFNPEFFLWDGHRAWRRERFEDTVVVVGDRRYKRDELHHLVETCGIAVDDIRPVRLGRWNEALPDIHPRAKELLLFGHII